MAGGSLKTTTFVASWFRRSSGNTFPSNEVLRVKDITEYSEEFGNRKLRPKERVLAKANRANTRRCGKITPTDFAGRLHVPVLAV